jgi:transcriptional regulator
MHPSPTFHWQDQAAMAAFATSVGFGMLFLHTPNGPRVAHIPFVLTGDGMSKNRAVQFHLAKGNAIAAHLAGSDGLLVVNGPDAYVSADDYNLPDQVPTWNYIAVEMEGPVRRMEREVLVAFMDDLSAQEEAQLAPKTPWTRAKMDPKRFDAMMGGIIGFEMEICAFRGTAKLGQNKPEAARMAVADALDARGRRAMAHVMRGASDFQTAAKD